MSTHCDKCGEPWLPLKRDLSPWLSYCFNCGNEGPFWNDVLSERQHCKHVFDETDDGKTICSLCGAREMDMKKCCECATYHYGNDPCPYREVERLQGLTELDQQSREESRDDTQRVTPQDDRDYDETLRVERSAWVLLRACREAWSFLNEEPIARTLQERMRVNAILRNALSRATGGQEP